MKTKEEILNRVIETGYSRESKLMIWMYLTQEDIISNTALEKEFEDRLQEAKEGTKTFSNFYNWFKKSNNRCSEKEKVYVPREGDFFYVKSRTGASYVGYRDAVPDSEDVLHVKAAYSVEGGTFFESAYICCKDYIEELRPATNDEKYILIGKAYEASNNSLMVLW